MNAPKTLKTWKAVSSLTLQLVTAKATEGSNSKIWKSSFFLQI